MLTAREDYDRGAGAIEYGAMVVVAAVLLGALLASGVLSTVSTRTTEAVCDLTGGDCGAPENGGAPADDPGAPGVDPALYTGPGDGVQLVNASNTPPPDGKGLDHDRRDAGRDSARDREDDTGRREDPQEPEEPSGDPPHQEDGLGEPVPGESVPTPDPPPWEPVDEGAGEHGSDGNPIDDYFVKAAAETGAHALSGTWPDASRNLLHFLGNSGDPLEQDVDKILDDVPEFQETIDQHNDRLGATAIEQAKEDGADGPVTFPINTGWTGYGYDPPYENQNWFYASGGWQYNLAGQVTAYPPSEPGGEWRYETSTTVNWRDQYNWDGGKKVNIGPMEVTDEELAALHRAGVAQEYMMYGQSDPQTSEGTG